MIFNDFVKFTDIELKDGFWKERYNLNKNVSVTNVAKRFEESGRFDALRFNYHEKGTIQPHIFFDSDVAKWIEAVAYLIENDPSVADVWTPMIDEMVDCMEKAQREDGYLNSYHQQIKPDLIYQIRDHHELYCTGHLIEAAIAYDRATGKSKFLKIMEKSCDCIEKAFFTEKTAAFETPGHEEIELALFALYKYTGKEKYKTMAVEFVNRRGRNPNEQYVYPPIFRAESQDDLPVEDMTEAKGHSVRALYLYSGAADAALATGNENLKKALFSLFDDIVERKMYVTGGLGSTHIYEGFTVPYDLPNTMGYSESCCSIAMLLFALRMRKLDRNAKYGNAIERVMYNNLLSSTSIDGRSFFYSNPVEIELEDYARQSVARRRWLPQTDRVEVFQCSCCPPNINRIFARIADVICFNDEDCASIEQYIASSVNTAYGSLLISGNYAFNGKITVSSSNYSSDKLRLRAPEWCKKILLKLDGNNISTDIGNDGYIILQVKSEFELEIDFNIAPMLVASNPNVIENVGRVAMTYGPVVYCLEGVDNGAALNKISLSTDLAGADVKQDNDFCGFAVIEADGFRESETKKLYFDASLASKTPVRLKFIPYFAFANRGRSDMLVWIRRA